MYWGQNGESQKEDIIQIQVRKNQKLFFLVSYDREVMFYSSHKIKKVEFDKFHMIVCYFFSF